MFPAQPERETALPEQVRDFTIDAGTRIVTLMDPNGNGQMIKGVSRRELDGVFAALIFNAAASPLDSLTFSLKKRHEKQATRSLRMVEKIARLALDYKSADVSETDFIERALPLEKLTPEIVAFVEKKDAAHLLYLCRAGLALKEQRASKVGFLPTPAPPKL